MRFETSTSKTHYVYSSYEEDGRRYIGSRTCYDCTPEEDSYLGSYTDKTFFPTKKDILVVCKTRDEANLIEDYLHLHFDVMNNPLYANLAGQTKETFDMNLEHRWR